MNTLIINVDTLSLVDEVIDAVQEEGLAHDIDLPNLTITVEHELAVRVMRLYIRLTGRTPQHIAFPCVIVYEKHFVYDGKDIGCIIEEVDCAGCSCSGLCL